MTEDNEDSSANKKAEEELEKVKEFAEQIKQLVGNNYSTMTVDTDRHNGGVTIENNPDLHNCVRARVYVRPNQYNTHIDTEDVREMAEEMGAIASGQRATSITSTREARTQSKQNYHEKYPGPVSVVEIGGSERRGFPIFEIEYTIPVF